MGLFDEVVCEIHLPDDLNPAGLVFQTKSFENPRLDTYRIADDGTLWVITYELVANNEPLPGMRYIPPFKRINESWEQVEGFRGEIVFYGSPGDWRQDWHEYSALFADGKLVSIVTVAPR